MKNEMKRETKQEEDVKNVGLELYIDADKDEYFKCSMYYMRRYFGLREIILLAILLGLGLALFFVLNNLFVLILFAVSVVIILIALTLFIVTARGIQARRYKTGRLPSKIGIHGRRDFGNQL